MNTPAGQERPSRTVDGYAPKVVLITGAAGFLGGHLAARLAARSEITRVIVVDTVSPSRDMTRKMGRAEFVRVDIRNPLIGKVMTSAGVDTVVHTGLTAIVPKAGRALIKDLNVLGAMQLLAACQKLPSLRKVVLKSSGSIYGSGPRDPAMFTESMPPSGKLPDGFARDASEVEGYARGLARRRPDVDLTVLRLANIIGPRLDSPFSRYFSRPVVPSMWGRDARIQLLHDEDALDALALATLSSGGGVYNVAGSGAMLLSQAVRRAGLIGLSLPGPAIDLLGLFLRGLRLQGLAEDESRFLVYGRILDTTKLSTELGMIPRWTTEAAFDDFLRTANPARSISPATVREFERRAVALAGQL